MRRSGGWMALTALVVLTPIGGAVAATATQDLVILHDNDIHGHLREFCYVETAKGPGEHCHIGGAARRASLIRRLRFRAHAPVLLIDSGDTSTRGPLTTEYEGRDEIAAMNALHYDMAAIGNNEFKLKDAADAADVAGAQASLRRLVASSRFPWICANVTGADGAPLRGVRPFVVRRVGQLRIAFLGLTTQRSSTYLQTTGLTVTDPVAAAQAWIPRARQQADVVIAVTHIGVDDDRRLVKGTRGLDVVVGGDSHTFLYAPVEERNLDGRTVPIVQDGEFGVRLGEMRLRFERGAHGGWRLARSSDVLLPIDAHIPADPRIAALVERYARPLDVTVGKGPAIGGAPQERLAQTAQQLASIWRDRARTDVGLQPPAGIFEVFRTRAVTRYQLHAILPFHDTLWSGHIEGARLKALLAAPTPAGPMGSTIAAADVDPTRTYTIATTDFAAKGALIEGADTGVDVRQAAEDWLGKPPPYAGTPRP